MPGLLDMNGWGDSFGGWMQGEGAAEAGSPYTDADYATARRNMLLQLGTGLLAAGQPQTGAQRAERLQGLGSLPGQYQQDLRGGMQDRRMGDEIASERQLSEMIASGQPLPGFNANQMAILKMVSPSLRPKVIAEIASRKGDVDEFGLQPVWTKDPVTGKYRLFQSSKGGGDPREMQFPPGVEPAPPVTFQDLGTTIGAYSTRGGDPVGAPVSKDIRGAAAEGAIGKGAGEATFDLPRAEGTMTRALDTIEALKVHPGRQIATGKSAWIGGGYTPEGYDFNTKLAQLKGQTFLEAYSVLKGGGQITEIEGQKATDAFAALQSAQSEEQFNSALTELEAAFKMGFAKLQKQAAMTSKTGAQSGEAGTPRRLKYNPATGELE